MAPNLPAVTVLIPTYQEADAIDACLDAVAAQTYRGTIETLVIDGGSNDGTQDRAAAHDGVTVLSNPDRIQSAALNIGIDAAAGEIIVRVDGHSLIAPDYVARCVTVLADTSAAMVGGGMTPVAEGWVQEGIAAAMGSPFGAGPARFHTGGEPGGVDTVYLGAFPIELAQKVGGYAADLAINEDAEFAHRMSAHGSIWFDPTIRSTYTPRATLGALGRQFFRYGRGRARTAVRHPDSFAPRQLAAPLLIVGLASPARRWVAAAYAVGLAGAVVHQARKQGSTRGLPPFAAALPVMHLSWGTGFLVGLPAALAHTRSAGETDE